MKIGFLASSEVLDAIQPTEHSPVSEFDSATSKVHHDETAEDCSVSTEIVIDNNNGKNCSSSSSSSARLQADARDDDSVCSVQTERCSSDVEEREDAVPIIHAASPLPTEETEEGERRDLFVRQKGISNHRASKKNNTENKANSITKDAESASGQVHEDIDCKQWRGRVVGLFLPPHVDPAFDAVAKPSHSRRVDPSLFQRGSGQDGDLSFWRSGQWNPWYRERPVLKGCNNKGASLEWENDKSIFSVEKSEKEKEGSISLDIYLFNQNDAADAKAIKIHMVRNPSEEISKTCQRIQISLEKKVGNATKRKRSKKKCGQEGVSLVPLLLEQQDKSDVHLAEDKEALATDLILETLTMNLCSLRSDLTHPSPKLADGELEGYKPIGYTENSTIADAIHRAKRHSGRHVLSIPITIEAKTVWVPLMLDSCPPTITSVSTFGSFQHTHIFERTPIVVNCTSLYATHVRISWFVDGNEVCPDSSWYAPTASDIGKRVAVVLVPMRPGHDGWGCAEAYEFQRFVEPLPEMPVMSLREGWKVQRRCNDDDGASNLRVVTYNILADQNASRDVEKQNESERIYSHCELKHIIKWRRHALIVHELLDYQPDIICLQEVDADVFRDLLHPVMNVMGYQGYYSQKGVGIGDGVREGCALFWALDDFENVRVPDMQTHTFREMIEAFSCEERMHKNQWKSLRDMSDLLQKHDHLRHVLFNKLGHVLQTVVLTKRCDGEQVVVGNTHLFYHPHASHIRCLKMLMACRQLEIQHMENQFCPIILCGDFNSHPDSGVMKLLLNRYLDSGNGRTWKHLCTYEWEEGAAGNLHHDVEAIDLEFPPSFPKFASGYNDEECPEFTHLIEAFVCTLDYILVTENFADNKSSAPTPTLDSVKKYIAMPNENFPSDHISLACDLSWR